MTFRLLVLFALALAGVRAQREPAFAAHAHAANQSLLWSTYRPNLYFGMRPRVPHSLLTGLIWWGAHDYKSYTRARHTCDQGDGLKSYTFTEHDGRTAAKEVIEDDLNNVRLLIELLKVPDGDAGGSWAVRISGSPIDEAKGARISLLNYFGNDGPLGHLELQNAEDDDGLEGDVHLAGSSQGLGDFSIRIADGSSNPSLHAGPHAEDFGERLTRTQYFGAPVPNGRIWEAKNVLMNSFLPGVQGIVERYKGTPPPDPALLFALPNEIRYGATLFGFQKTYEGNWSVDVFFDSGEATRKLDADTLTAGLLASSQAFHSRFASTFPLSPSLSPAHIAFAQHITANLIGGVGYFFGQSIVDRNFAHEWDDEDVQGKDPHPELTDARQLLTATPSRSFFPRGFYWDEGFHLLVIGAWDNDLSLEILWDWVSLIDEDGWVGREQILGDEARSKVPQEFQTQYPSYANPPTLAMALNAYISRLRQGGVSLEGIDVTQMPLAPSISSSTSAEAIGSLHLTEPALARSYLLAVYAPLKRHYDWFRESQRGQIKEWGRSAVSRTEGYRWRGRTSDHVLTSGLDDYPRAKPPHLGELHLDLICWMGFFSKTMSEIAEFLGESDDFVEFSGNYDAIVANIEALHWSDDEQMYCDLSVDDNDDSVHICHKGYISLFPFLLGLLQPDSPHLGAVLNLVRDPKHLWSPFGLRSLSTQSEYFGKGENYWRGPIWIQMNYLALSSLHKIYAKEAGPHQVQAAEIYDQLRSNVIDNVFQEYERTGYVWEQYDALTGEGKRSHPFTGWTSLLTLIMSEQY